MGSRAESLLLSWLLPLPVSVPGLGIVDVSEPTGSAADILFTSLSSFRVACAAGSSRLRPTSMIQPD